MGSTEPREHALGAAQLEACLALSQAAGWNQNAADWRLMLEIGRGWGLSLAAGTLVASTLVLPYGAFAWVSMVLVLPEHRRKGYASRLLRRALGELRAGQLTPVLDATPAGRAVYLQEGFHDTWSFQRYQLRSRTLQRADRADGIRPLAEHDWPRILALDAGAFGARRERLLRALAARLPAAALVLEQADKIRGFLLGRDGREACQLGPLVADAPEAAIALLDVALERVSAPLYLDAADHAAALVAWLAARGFEAQRPFTRMVHGGGPAPGDASKVMLVAGPELG
ncbi:MAG: GNAT family N-acetyltransferase [Betaproteobacteria bacterium]|jgi:GNAT superfamily N-acetyltransferase|nr:GNAT family N-acetyltransferase [Betaproteobacteria bacterium]